MKITYFMGIKYTLSANKNGGQYSGPCPWSGGTNRFTIEPQTNSWFCRSTKCDICSHGEGNGNYRFGKMDSEHKGVYVKPKPIVEAPPPDLLDKALRLHGAMHKDVLDYIHLRGINAETIQRFKLGSLNKTFVTIPLIYTWKGKLACNAIKRRWLPQLQATGAPSYYGEGKCSGIFNFDALADKTQPVGIIANSLFDVMLVAQYGFNVIGPFAGEADWKLKWCQHIPWRIIVNFGDWDEPSAAGKRAGTEYMLSRAFWLNKCPNVQRVVNVYPPDGYTDINAAALDGIDMQAFIQEVINANQ